MTSQLQKVSTNTRKYVDLDLSFEKHPVTGDIAMATGDSAILKSVRNLLFINFYERPFHPEKGSGVPQKLFEHISPITAQTLKTLIETAITNFEPRVRLIEVGVAAYPNRHYFVATISFYIRNNSQPTVLSQILQKVR